MILEKERIQIVEYGKKLITSNLTKGTGGNISIYNPNEKLIAITPSGIDYFLLKPEDIVVMDLEGNILEGKNKPSSEYEMHKIFYERRSDIFSVVHVHSTYSTTLACLRVNLPALHYLVAISGGKDIKCAKYATFGTKQLAENAFEAMEDRFAVLLANHGLLTGAKDLANAFNKAEEVEFCAQLYCNCLSIGKAVILEDEEMNKMLGLFNSYGQVKEKK